MIETTNRTGFLLNNSTSFVPKLSDGVTQAKLQNFETTFSPLIFEQDANMGFAISFRSDKPGVMLNDEGVRATAIRLLCSLTAKVGRSMTERR